MPRYEYECKHCGAGVEHSRLIAERHDTFRCQNCQAECAMVLVPSLSAFAFKGDGWTVKGARPAPPSKSSRPAGYDMTGDRDL